MKNTVIEITIYRETTVEWMKPRIKSIIGNIRKQKTTNSEQQEEKRIQKNEDSIKQPLGQL